MTQGKLYNVILTSRWNIAEHCNILLDFESNGDPAYIPQLKKLLNLLMNTQLLEDHYWTIEWSGESSLLSKEEILLLIDRNSELSYLPLKN